MPEKTTCSELLAAAAIGAIARMETTKRKRTRFADRVMRPPLLDWTTRVRKSPGSLAECGLLRGLSEKTGSGSQARASASLDERSGACWRCARDGVRERERGPRQAWQRKSERKQAEISEENKRCCR